MSRGPKILALALVLLARPTVSALAASDDSLGTSEDSLAVEAPEVAALPAESEPPKTAKARGRLEAMVPEIAEHPYRLDPGERPFLHRFSFSPGFGFLGSERLFTARAAYYPNSWLAYEGSIGHNPGQSVHAVLHMLNAIVRRPMQGRFQPYVSAGYGMIMVFPGQSVNADPVTKNALTAGGGLEFYIRGDLAVRGETQFATVIGQQRDHDGVVAYNYLHTTIGLSFYRTIAP
jgi:hypothetical protein